MLDFSGIDNTTGAFPNVEATDASGPTLRDGTPITADVINDIWGGFQAILNEAGTTPSDSVETSSASDLLDSIRKVGGAPGEVVMYASPSDVIDANIIPLKGQVISISAYPKLVAATYIGDTENSSLVFLAFYKCSDSDGNTRNTAGPYFKLPDCRGYFIRALAGAATGRDAARDYQSTSTGKDYRNMAGSYAGPSPGWHIHDVIETIDDDSLVGQTFYVPTTNPGNITGSAGTVATYARVLYAKSTAADSMLKTKIGRSESPSVDFSSLSYYDEVRPAHIAFQLGIRY
jgi:hypothetical protein